ncbi:MAG: hypothetical protein AB7R89_17095 [Dehalococcoidia bacterium]
MTTQADYTPEEWRAISEAPVSVALLIVTSDISGPIGITQELMATAKTALETGKQSSSALLHAIVASLESKDREKAERPKVSGKPEEVAQAMLAAITADVAIVEQKAPTEVEAYKAWLMAIAVQVANASKEGGFLGFGGTRVSGGEQAALERLATTLGVPPPAAAS